jgi:hypothetical protein
VIDGVVAHFALYSGGASNVWKFGEKVVDGVPLLIVLTLGISELAAWAVKTMM